MAILPGTACSDCNPRAFTPCASCQAVLDRWAPIVPRGDDEPAPLTFDFEPVHGIDIDVSAVAVAEALDRLGWTNAEPGRRPRLCVHPVNWPVACAIARRLNHAIVPWPIALADSDTWFVQYRGRRVGSQGA